MGRHCRRALFLPAETVHFATLGTHILQKKKGQMSLYGESQFEEASRGLLESLSIGLL